ncbi:MAG: hypothetical protein M3R15_23270, partial [Acidobacteriota bacterium]|nr:hypothetical protein [Acidobacteriota bacterium]
RLAKLTPPRVVELNHAVRDNCFLGLPVKRHIPIPFPRFPVIGRECLTPSRNIRVRFVPLKYGDDRLSFKNVLRVKLSEMAVERADLGNIQHDHIAVSPIDAPQFRLRIEKAQSHSCKRHTVKFGAVLIEVSEAIEYFAGFVCSFKFNPFLAVVKPRFEFPVVYSPSADPKIEILLR